MARGRLTVWFGFLGVAFTAPVAAQTGTTPPAPHPCDSQSGRTKLVCRAAYDAIEVMIPAAGLAASGGNPSLSGPGGGHRFGDLAISLRVNYLSVPLPNTFYDGSTDTVGLAKRFAFAVPSLDIRFGILSKKLPMGTVSADLLGNVLAMPKSETNFLRYGPEVRSVGGAAIGFGYGLRIAFDPAPPLPTASLNISKHDLPTFTYGDVGAGGNYGYTLSVSAINVRLLAGKRFGLFELTGGAGVDLLTGNYSVTYRDLTTGQPSARADSSQSAMRILVLTNGALLLGKIARLTVEGGFQIGKDDKLPTIFAANDTRAGRFFGGVGLGFKL
jgi:hypothetical protein